MNASIFFASRKIFTVRELDIYELLKFLRRSLYGHHFEKYLNYLFCFDYHSRTTRRSNKKFLKTMSIKSKTQKYSLLYRGSKLFDILHENNLIPIECQSINVSPVSSYVQRMKHLYVMGNYESLCYGEL